MNGHFLGLLYFQKLTIFYIHTNTMQINNNPLLNPTPQPFTGSHDADKFLSEVPSQGYLMPYLIKLPVIIELMGKGTKKERTRRSRVSCRTDPASFHTSVLYLFKQESIKIPLGLFTIGYAKHEKEIPTSIYNWDLSTVDLEEFDVIVITQREEPEVKTNDNDTITVRGNKQKYAKETSAMNEADIALRKALGPECYDKLRRNRRVYCEAKDDLVCLCLFPLTVTTQVCHCINRVWVVKPLVKLRNIYIHIYTQRSRRKRQLFQVQRQQWVEEI